MVRHDNVVPYLYSKIMMLRNLNYQLLYDATNTVHLHKPIKYLTKEMLLMCTTNCDEVDSFVVRVPDGAELMAIGHLFIEEAADGFLGGLFEFLGHYFDGLHLFVGADDFV